MLCVEVVVDLYTPMLYLKLYTSNASLYNLKCPNIDLKKTDFLVTNIGIDFWSLHLCCSEKIMANCKVLLFYTMFHTVQMLDKQALQHFFHSSRKRSPVHLMLGADKKSVVFILKKIHKWPNPKFCP